MKKSLALMLVAALLLSSIFAVVSAEELPDANGEAIATGQWMVELDPEELDGFDVDPDELFTMYVAKLMYGGVSTFGSFNVGEKRLDGQDLAAYHILKDFAEDIAAGKCASATLELTVEDIGVDTSLSYTAQELGLEQGKTIWSDTGALTNEARNAVWGVLGFDLNMVVDSLLADCPESWYWFDKTQGTQAGISYSYWRKTKNGEPAISFDPDSAIHLNFLVSEGYRATPNDGYSVDTGKTGAAVTAIGNAQAIVEEVATKFDSDYDKLNAYRKIICELVSYNDAAASGGAAYGDPWQLIYVFDGNPNTNVVCEGYSKAFQYLCDLSTFRNKALSCYSVTGDISGAHMWNIVTVGNGRNYLVDVTNCDTGTIGYSDMLFLKTPASGNAQNGYRFQCGYNSITYRYDPDTRNLYTVEELTLSAEDFPSYEVQMGDIDDDGVINEEDLELLTKYLAHWDGYGVDSLNLDAADFNDDGKVNTVDRIILARHLAGWQGYETL